MSNIRLISFVITIVFILASKGVFKGLKKKVDNGESSIGPATNNTLKPSKFKEAYDLWRGGNPKEALTVLYESKQNTSAGNILLGEVYLELKEYDLAASAFKNSISKGATAFAYSRLAEIAEYNELYADAIKLYNKALKYKDAEKGYIYHELGNMYMYTGQDEKSDKIFEKAEAYHAEGSSTKLSYDFTLKSANSKPKYGLAVFFILLVMLVVGLVLFVAVEDTTSYDDFEVAVEDVVEEVSDDLPIQVSIVQVLGNSNSNIHYGGHLVSEDNFIYTFEDDAIVKTNEDSGETEFITFSNGAFNFNKIEDNLFYIDFTETSSEIIQYNLESGEAGIYAATDAWNLLVDENNIFFLDDRDVQTLVVNSYNNGQQITIDIDNVWAMNQSSDSLFFLKDNMIYSILKNDLTNQMDLFAKASIVIDLNVNMMLVEGDYIYYTLEDDNRVFMADLYGYNRVTLLEGFDHQNMTLNISNIDIFVGVDEGDYMYTDVYNINGDYAGTIDDVIGNQVSEAYIYWYPAE